MTAKWLLPFVLVLGVTATRAAGPSVTIDAATLNTTIRTSLRLNVTEASTGHAAGITNEGYWVRAALGDAAYMTRMEKNADILVMNGYAPMLVNVNPGARPWRPNLIGYHGSGVCGSPSSYAIKMFSTNLGDEILKTTTTDTDVLTSVTRDSTSGAIYVKLVNASDADVPLPIILTGTRALASTATALTLSADPQATNTIDAPARVVPVRSTVTGVKSGFTYTVPKQGIVVLTMWTR